MSSYLDDVLGQFEKNKDAASGNSRMSQDELRKKFFNIILPDGKTSGEKRIRIIPPKSGKLDQVRFHEIQVDGKWVKLWDPAQEGERSPLNEVRESLLATGDESDRELSKNYSSKLFYIFKVIDRDHEEDGPKFWRFKHSYKGEGALDKLYPILKKIGNVDDPEKGRDLTLYINLTSANNGKTYSKISTIMAEDPSPLSDDSAKMKEWVEDNMVWSDAYSKKPVEYLEIVALGGTPKWNKDLKKWVSEEGVENNSSSENKEEENVKFSKDVKVESEEDYDAQLVDESDSDEDDLPF